MIEELNDLILELQYTIELLEDGKDEDALDQLETQSGVIEIIINNLKK